ncbi:glycosyl transferase group 1 [Cryobacterium sp. N22]|uniref:rhamnosyltransferase WsaF family glycosyltransferase n=1 Tax=Cryobacterium sp. N22 TaxID=2048290 RepID=UPI000CE392D2|nr:glycosyl transferase group 1 [Cryobacterium sp. N22]
MTGRRTHRVEDLAALVARARRQGIRELGQRGVNRLYRAMDVGQLEFPLLPGDVMDSRRLQLPVPDATPPTDRPARVGWVCTPPAAGSGGHTTLIRMIIEVERQGHECVLFLYDRHGGDIRRQERTIREHWPELRATVQNASAGIRGVDACVASGWQTAHALASHSGGAAMRRLYFIQDYEPYFYPRGSLYALAEDSYRFGFRPLALGHMVAELLRSEVGVEPDVVEFGCDTSVYSLTNAGDRAGVVFYEKPGNDRRGFVLGRLALEEFHRTHPDQPIHLYGGAGSHWTIPVIRHGRLTPAELNRLYNQTVAGIAMSFTNISLVAEEMLAAGTIPIINDAATARADLAHSEAVWALPTPSGIAEALAATVSAPGQRERAKRAAAGARAGWDATAQNVAALILAEIYTGPLGDPVPEDAQREPPLAVRSEQYGR